MVAITDIELPSFHLMNLLPNKFVGFESLPSENQQIASVVGRLFIENESGLLVVMESKRLDCASMAWNVPLTVNRLNLQQQGPEMGTPIEILKHMQSCEMNF
jgi:hypothetical protein